MGNSYRLKSAQVILPPGICARWSHIPHCLRLYFAKGYKKTVAFTSTVFKTAVIDHSTTSPIQYVIPTLSKGAQR